MTPSTLSRGPGARVKLKICSYTLTGLWQKGKVHTGQSPSHIVYQLEGEAGQEKKAKERPYLDLNLCFPDPHNCHCYFDINI